jgi:AcrR family transcriptional regulator
MTAPDPTRRLRRDGEATRRRVLDAAVETVLDVGYYHASSNEIGRRAGVTWSSIQHLFGTRSGLMHAVVVDAWQQLEERVTTAEITGDTLEERLRGVLDVLATFYESPGYVVQLQIMLDRRTEPRRDGKDQRWIGPELASTWHPLFATALGDAAQFDDLVEYAFTSLRGYLASRTLARHMTTIADDDTPRALLVEGVAAALRNAAARRGVMLDEG